MRIRLYTRMGLIQSSANPSLPHLHRVDEEGEQVFGKFVAQAADHHATEVAVEDVD